MNTLPPISEFPAMLSILRGRVCLRIDSIVRLEADRNYTRFVLDNGQVFLTSKNISFYEHLLPAFLRVHKSYLLNAHYICTQTSTHLYMSDGKKVEVSRRKRGVMKNITV